MAYNFTETLVLQIPNVEQQVTEFIESDKLPKKGIIVEVAGVHAGKTSNHNHYTAEELEKAIDSWVSPYPKPVILNHDVHSEPVGRVMAAKMDTEADGTPFTRLQLAITDPNAIEKILSQRYLTGSVGGKATEALCSLCNANWTEASAGSAPCKHRRGKTYKGEVAEIIMKGIEFKEYSWVNMPADGRSGVLAVSTDAAGVKEEAEFADDDWVRSARVFELSMDSESVFELTESENIDVLSSMKKKEATPLYDQLKGAYLNALAATEDVTEDEDDILSATSQLSEDLAKVTVVPVETEEEEVAEELNGEPKGAPEGQEKPHRGDIDPERSTGAPINRASDDSEEEVAEDTSDQTLIELNETISTLESQVTELETVKATLTEENAKLKAALKRGLVERVVDTKIALGISEADSRAELIEDHLARSASSLADSLRDLMSMPQKTLAETYQEIPKVTNHKNSVAVLGSSAKEAVGHFVSLEETQKEPQEIFESAMVDVLMGRKQLR